MLLIRLAFWFSKTTVELIVIVEFLFHLKSEHCTFMRSIECVAMTLKRISENWNETEKANIEMLCPYSVGLRLNQISEVSKANLRHCNNLGIFGRLSSIMSETKKNKALHVFFVLAKIAENLLKIVHLLYLYRLCKMKGCIRGLRSCTFASLNLIEARVVFQLCSEKLGRVAPR